METIGIIGSGSVGKSLASGFLQKGYRVMLGTRSSEKFDELQAELEPGIKVDTFRETARFGEILVLAVKGSAAASALKACGTENLEGKIIIDVTNPIADTDPEDGVLKFFTPEGASLMEDLQQQFPGTHFVKAFNSVGAAHMTHPDFGDVRPTMFICGNDKTSRKRVSDILDSFGWDTEDLGSAKAAGSIEHLCILWCIPGFLHNQWNHAFKLLKKT